MGLRLVIYGHKVVQASTARLKESTFAHLPHVKCLTHPEESFDIAVLGCPFDTAVSYRPGLSLHSMANFRGAIRA